MDSVILRGTGVETVLTFENRACYTNGSAIVVPFCEGRLVLVYNVKRQGWEFPGGKMADGETAEECARRELQEETGMTGGDYSFLCSYVVQKNGEELIGSIFSCKVSGYEPLSNDKNIAGVGLFTECPTDLSMKDGYIEFMFKRFGIGR